MELQHVNIKFFVDGDLQVDLEKIIEVFHRWTAEQSMDEMLIDVADYRHVPAGPGVVLVGHEADYALDNAGNRPGLLYNRKASLAGGNADRFRQALTAASKACDLLEVEFSHQFMFNRQELELIINDRALAPNTVNTFETCKPDLEAFLASIGQADAELSHDTDDPRRRFSVKISLKKPLELAV